MNGLNVCSKLITERKYTRKNLIWKSQHDLSTISTSIVIEFINNEFERNENATFEKTPSIFSCGCFYVGSNEAYLRWFCMICIQFSFKFVIFLANSYEIMFYFVAAIILLNHFMSRPSSIEHTSILFDRLAKSQYDSVFSLNVWVCLFFIWIFFFSFHLQFN